MARKKQAKSRKSYIKVMLYADEKTLLEEAAELETEHNNTSTWMRDVLVKRAKAAIKKAQKT